MDSWTKKADTQGDQKNFLLNCELLFKDIFTRGTSRMDSWDFHSQYVAADGRETRTCSCWLCSNMHAFVGIIKIIKRVKLLLLSLLLLGPGHIVNMGVRYVHLPIYI